MKSCCRFQTTGDCNPGNQAAATEVLGSGAPALGFVVRLSAMTCLVFVYFGDACMQGRQKAIGLFAALIARPSTLLMTLPPRFY